MNLPSLVVAMTIPIIATASTTTAIVLNSGTTEVPVISIFSAPGGKPIDRVLMSAVVAGSPGSTNSVSSINATNGASDPSSVVASIRFRGSLMSSVPHPLS